MQLTVGLCYHSTNNFSCAVCDTESITKRSINVLLNKAVSDNSFLQDSNMNFVFAKAINNCPHPSGYGVFASVGTPLKVYLQTRTQDGHVNAKNLRTFETGYVSMKNIKLLSPSSESGMDSDQSTSTSPMLQTPTSQFSANSPFPKAPTSANSPLPKTPNCLNSICYSRVVKDYKGK